MNKEEYTIKLDMIATFEDKQIRVEDLLEQLFKENKKLKEKIAIIKEVVSKPWYISDVELAGYIKRIIDGSDSNE